MKHLKTFALLGLALFLSLCTTPNRADAAELSIDTPYGEMYLSDGDYANHFMWKDSNGITVVFYNGDLTMTSISANAVTFKATGNSKCWSTANGFVASVASEATYTVNCAITGSDSDFHRAYYDLSYYASNKELTFTDGVATKSFKVRKYITEKQAAEFLKEQIANGVTDYRVFRYEGNILLTGVDWDFREGDSACSPTNSYATTTVTATVFDGENVSEGVAVGTEGMYGGLSFLYYHSWLKNKASDIVLFATAPIAVESDATQGAVLYTIAPKYADVNTATFDTFAGMTAVDVDIEPTTVNVVVPLNVNVAIDVNQEEGVVHGDIIIQNNTKAPVKIGISKFASTNLPFTSLIVPESLPAGLDWDLLSAENSAKYFSFGLTTNDDGTDAWKSPAANTVWAIPNFKPKAFAVINSEASSNLTVEAFFGRTQAKTNAFTFSVTFVAELE